MRQSIRGAVLGASFASLLVSVTGCATAPREASGITRAVRKNPPPASSRSAVEEKSPHIPLATIPAGALGPRLVGTEEGWVAVWAVPNGDERGLYSAFISDDAPPSQPRRLGPVDPSARTLTLGLNSAGQVLASLVHRGGTGDILSVTRLGGQGQLLVDANVVATTPTSVLFSRIVPTALGALVIWVERGEQAADLYTAVVDEKGPRRPIRLVRGITSWQVSHEGPAVAVATREGDPSATIVLRQLGDSGETIGAPLELARDIEGGLDLDLAMTQDQILVAWTDQDAYESRVMGTLLDASGNVLSTARPVTVPRGEQALIGLTASGGTFHVVWGEHRSTATGGTELFVGGLGSELGTVAPDIHLHAARQDPLLPLFRAGPAGLALLSDFEVCDEDPCTTPVMKRGVGLIPAGTEAPRSELLTLPRTNLAMAWDLECNKQGCAYLLADDQAPAHVFVSKRLPRSSEPGLVSRDSVRVPRVKTHETLGSLPELTELVAVANDGQGKASIVSWLSYFDPAYPYEVPSSPAPDGRRAPLRARLSTMNLSGGPGEEFVISYRARSLGGVSLVPPEKGRGLLAWSAVDGKEPQLFATVVDAQGEKSLQKMLTNTPGEVTDVAAVRTPTGYLLAWIDGQGESPEVYALAVSPLLVPAGAARRVSHGANSASGVVLQLTKAGVLCAWSDARTARTAGESSIYQTILDPGTAEPQRREEEVVPSEGHAHSPQFQPGASGKSVLAWIENDPAAKVRRSFLHFAVLQDSGASASVKHTWTADGLLSDFSLQCAAGRCRVVSVVSQRRGSDTAQVSLWAADLGNLAEAPTALPQEVLPLRSTSPEGISPELVGNEVLFADRGAAGEEWTLRRATIAWGD